MSFIWYENENVKSIARHIDKEGDASGYVPLKDAIIEANAPPKVIDYIDALVEAHCDLKKIFTKPSLILFICKRTNNYSFNGMIESNTEYWKSLRKSQK